MIIKQYKRVDLDHYLMPSVNATGLWMMIVLFILLNWFRFGLHRRKKLGALSRVAGWQVGMVLLSKFETPCCTQIQQPRRGNPWAKMQYRSTTNSNEQLNNGKNTNTQFNEVRPMLPTSSGQGREISIDSIQLQLQAVTSTHNERALPCRLSKNQAIEKQNSRTQG